MLDLKYMVHIVSNTSKYKLCHGKEVSILSFSLILNHFFGNLTKIEEIQPLTLKSHLKIH